VLWCGEGSRSICESSRPNDACPGLELPAAAAGRFYNARTSGTDQGGLKLRDQRYQPGTALAALDIPLRFQFLPVSALDEDHFSGLLVQLTSNSSEDYDIMFNLDRAVLDGTRSSFRATAARPREHTVVHDIIVGQLEEGASMRIRVIDPAADSPKWREFEAGRLLLAMQTLGDEELGGVWLLYSLDEADSSDDPDLNDLRFQPPTSTPVRSRLSTPSLQSSAPPASFCNRPVSVASSSEQEHDVFVAQYASGMLR
jgi:hypothetical protein